MHEHRHTRSWLGLRLLALWGVWHAPLMAAAQSIEGSWAINGNGDPGTLAITKAVDGTISGTFSNRDATDTLQGYYAESAHNIVFLRARGGAGPIQAFIGTVAADFSTMQGTFYGLRAAGNIGDRNVWAFAAARTTPPTTLPQRQAMHKAAGVVQRMAVNANNSTGVLSIETHDTNGDVSGHILNNEIRGTYSSEGTLSFLRYENGAPSQVYFGEATDWNDLVATGFEGNFFTLTPASGASTQGFTYDWHTEQLPAELCSNGVDDDFDGQTDWADSECSRAERCNNLDDDHNGEVDDTPDCHLVSVLLSNIDDTGRIWFLPANDNREIVACDIDSGEDFPRSGRCDLSKFMREQLLQADVGTFIVRLGNGGGGWSSGDVSVRITHAPNGPNNSETSILHADGAFRSNGWFAEQRFRVDFRRGQLLFP